MLARFSSHFRLKNRTSAGYTHSALSKKTPLVPSATKDRDTSRLFNAARSWFDKLTKNGNEVLGDSHKAFILVELDSSECLPTCFA